MTAPDPWTDAMRRGDFPAAWAIAEKALARRDPATRDDPRLPYHLRWVWDGRPFEGQNVLVRSLVVLPQARHRGIGGGMLALLLRRAFDEGGREAWLLTTTAAPFFERAGFKPMERTSAPASVLATRQAANLCPASAALLRRSIHL